MIWVGINNQAINEPFKVNERVKMNSANHCNFFLHVTNLLLFQCEILMQSNAHSNVTRFIHVLFEYKRFTGKKITERPPLSTDLSPIENLWLIIEIKLYEIAKQYNSKRDR